MILPFMLALLAFIVLLAILAPLLQSSRPVPTRASFDQAVYRDQLRELDREIDRGLITPAEADASRLEIQRRLLAADRLPQNDAQPQARLSRSPLLAAVIFLIIGAGSVTSYVFLGAPGIPDEPFAARPPQASAEAISMQQATDQLAEKLRQNPADAPSWLLYARSLAMTGQWDKAESAYRKAMDLGQPRTEILADYAEVLVMQAGGTITPAAEKAFQQVLQAEPGNGIARYYLAMAASQAGEPRKAIDGLQALLADMPANSPLREQIGQRIAEAARAAGIPMPDLAKGLPPGPDAGAMAEAANLPQDQRDAMIRGMVAKLAAKQQADPANLDGWLKLGQAYAVLHQPEEAAAAYEKAAALKPDDAGIPMQAARALLGDQKPTDKIPPRVIALLRRVQGLKPNEPMVLWYLGMAAAQNADPISARQYWKILLTQLPEGSEDRRMIQTALDTLPPG